MLWLVLSGLLVFMLTTGCGGGGGDADYTPVVSPDGVVQVNETAAQEALARLNHYRMATGVMPVTLDGYFSQGCQAHADYLFINDIDLGEVGLAAHSESPSLPGYSPEGNEAGVASIIYHGAGPEEAVDNWMRTFYHRLGLFNPNLERIGFGSAGEYQVLDATRGRTSGLAQTPGPVVFPAPGMQDVNGSYKREIPHPVPGDDSLGVPITIEFYGNRGNSITSVQASVVDLTLGQEVGCYLQYPFHPLLAGWDPGQLIALIPRDPLAGGHLFRVTVSARVDGELWDAEWSFTTR